MSGKHRKVRVRRAGVLGIATVGVLLAASSGVAVASTGTSAPAPKDCTDVVAALIAARVVEHNTGDALTAAQLDLVAKLKILRTSNSDQAEAKSKADALQQNLLIAKTALAHYDSSHGGKGQPPVDKAERGKLVADLKAAQEAYDSKTDGYDYWRARQAAAADRQTAATGPWQAAGSKASDLRKADHEQNRVIAALQIRVGQLCVDAPPVPPAPVEAQPVQEAPPPATVEEHLPVTH